MRSEGRGRLAEIMLAMQLRKHQENTLTFVHTYLAECGKVWQ
jgi:hypothetical protein